MIGRQEGEKVQLEAVIHSICKKTRKVKILPGEDGSNPNDDNSKTPPAPSQQDTTAITAFNFDKSSTNKYDAAAPNIYKFNATVSSNNDSLKPLLMHLIPQIIWLTIVKLFGTGF